MTERVPLWTAEQVRAAERPLLEAGEPLMRRAASALAAVLREQLRDAGGTRILVVAGGGDNGGDALYAAAELAETADVDILLVTHRMHEQAFAAAVAAGARHVELPAVRDAAPAYDVIVDGIVGIGASRDPALRGTARETVSALLPAVAEGRSRVVAVDLPSGLHPDTGEANGVVLPAAVTVTFGAAKAGLFSGRGPALAGEVVLVDLGLGADPAQSEPVGEGEVARIYRA